VIGPREQFARTVGDLVETRPDTALVYAEISGQYVGGVRRRHPDRVLNVGIREQLLVNVGAGLALTGLRPVVHTFGSFLVERAFEQVKLGFSHQDVGGVLVGAGGSFDVAAGGRTHQSPGDVALMSTLPAVTVVAPGTAREVDGWVRRAVADDGLWYVRVVSQTNRETFPTGSGLHVVRRGEGGTVVALGPVLDAVLEATAQRDLTVLYSAVVRPFDAAGLRAALSGRDVVVVEPWLVGTSAHEVSLALMDVPHRLLCLGVGRSELRRYGGPEEHIAAHGLAAEGLRASIDGFLGTAGG
jgi:transketolase